MNRVSQGNEILRNLYARNPNITPENEVSTWETLGIVEIYTCTYDNSFSNLWV